jgi:hypothetical protein
VHYFAVHDNGCPARERRSPGSGSILEALAAKLGLPAEGGNRWVQRAHPLPARGASSLPQFAGRLRFPRCTAAIHDHRHDRDRSLVILHSKWSTGVLALPCPSLRFRGISSTCWRAVRVVLNATTCSLLRTFPVFHEQHRWRTCPVLFQLAWS